MNFIIKHIKYARYVIVHKWYTFVECSKRGIFWQGILHDISKLSPSEWLPYTNYFYGKKCNSENRDWKGKTKPVETGDKLFDLAWLKHIHRNPHHWQFWVLAEDCGKIKVMEMPDRYRKEMLSDWIAAGKAQGYIGEDECMKWYLKNKDRMIFHPDTRKWIEKELKINTI